MNVLEKILEEIEERIKRLNEADNMCRVNAERNRNFESMKYFQSLMFATERTESVIGDIIRSHMDEAENDNWIPVEERLPNQNGVYNVTRLIDDAFISDSVYFDGQDTWHNDNRVNHARPYLTDIVAWQPLPKQYKPKKTIPVAGMDHIMSRFTKVE